MRKRALSFALCLCMMLSLLPIPVMATGNHVFTDAREIQDVEGTYFANVSKNGYEYQTDEAIITDSKTMLRTARLATSESNSSHEEDASSFLGHIYKVYDESILNSR